MTKSVSEKWDAIRFFGWSRCRGTHGDRYYCVILHRNPSAPLRIEMVHCRYTANNLGNISGFLSRVTIRFIVATKGEIKQKIKASFKLKIERIVFNKFNAGKCQLDCRLDIKIQTTDPNYQRIPGECT